MEYKKKTIIWEDNNEPPKDYIWAKKDGKFYEYSYTTRSWVESKSISGESGNSDDGGEDDSGGGGDIPSKEVTINDVVKFMHDTIAGVGYGELFPYETWDEIPDIINASINTVGKSTTDSALMQDVFLNLPGYIVGTPKSM